ncbi:hypothetical protein ACHHYP_00016, partial [Achlya hypogyna]
MSWVLGGNRSLRRLVIFFFFSFINYILVNALAFTVWIMWIVISFVLQACLAPFQKGGVRGFWKTFVRENIYTGFLEWMCRWEIRVRNVYDLKHVVDPSSHVAIGPYVGRVAFYFIFWKALESFTFNAVEGFSTIVYPMYYDEETMDTHFDQTGSGSDIVFDVIKVPKPNAPYTTLAFLTIAVILVTLLVLRILAWIICGVCRLCISPVFRPKYKYTTTEVIGPKMTEYIFGSKHDGYVLFDDSDMRIPPVAPRGEAALGVTAVANTVDFYCIPVPAPPEPAHAKSPTASIPLLESIRISGKDVVQDSRPEASPHTNNRRTFENPLNRLSSLAPLMDDEDPTPTPQRTLFVAPTAQAPSYDSFGGSYQALSSG